MASSSLISFNSNLTPSWKYHAFLSFRGEDTRNNFTDHLYDAIRRKGFRPFRDDEELKRGEVIKPELLKAIEESLVSIVILSRNYASSSWCLDELQKILESGKTLRRGVLPIFYNIDPSVVRYQTKSFAKAFKTHEKRFGEGSNKVQSWRNALSEVASLSGYHSKNWPETELIEEIIRMLCRRVESHLPSYSKDGLVGIDTKLEDMYQILEIGLSEVRFVGIWGMGGIGKTTLAKFVFNRFRSYFDISCCIENVREKSSAMDGLLNLQIKLLSKLKIGGLEIDNLDQGKATIKNLLSQRKVLLLLDDVDERKQLEYLAGNRDWFGQGSRVLVTTRDMRLLELHEAPFRNYEIRGLNTDESFELFYQNAFKRKQPEEGYLELSKTVVHYCQGLPLALEVLGSSLWKRDISIWKDVVNKMIKDPPKKILDILRISYEGLEDAEKMIFLDIACLFKRWYENRVIQILENCGFNHKIGIQILIERALLKRDNGLFWMHDLLQEMGKHIVIQKSGNEISKQSRLWSSKDVDKVLKKNKGTEFIEGIVLGAQNYEACWDPNAFVKMCKLRILIILHGFPLSLGLKCLSDSIKVLEWNEYPLESLPHCEELNNLVELKMHGSRIKQLWNGIHNFEDLKFIDLSYSEHLIRSPNFFGVPNLESLILVGCSNLVEIHESVRQLKKLVVLNLKDCINLKCLPSKLEMPSLKYLILSGCSALWEWVFGSQRPPMTLNISGLPMLRILDVSFCNLRDGSIPDGLSCLSSLEQFNSSGNDFANLPLNCISNLSRLWKLDLSFCPKLQSLPVFPPSLRQVSARNCGLMEPLPADQLWKLFMFDDEELRKRLWMDRIGRRRYVISIPGSEIPAWFDKDKQKNFPLNNSDLSQMSFIVDIPNCCRLSRCKWWGIVVCFLFEPLTSAYRRVRSLYHSMWILSLIIEPPYTYLCPDDESRTRWFVNEDMERGLNFHHQYIVLLSGNDDHIQRVLREGHSQLKIFFGTARIYKDLKISKCAWRVIYYEDEVWPKATISDFENMASNSSHKSSHKEVRFIEISSSDEEDATATACHKSSLKEVRFIEISSSSDEEGATATASDEELPAKRQKLKQKILD